MTADAAPDDIAPAAHPYRWTMLAGVWLLYFCFGLTTTALAPLIQPVTRDLAIGHAAMGTVLGAWPLVYIAAAVPCGALIDRLGARRALFCAALIIGASGLLRSVASGPVSMFLAVAVFGLGGPLVSIGAPKVISLWFAGKDRGLAMGLYITGPSLGGVAAFSLTNSVAMPLADGSWRLVLFGYAAFVLAAGGVWLLITAHGASRAVERRIAAEPRQPQRQLFRELIRLQPVRIVLLMSIGIFFFNHGLNNWLPEILRSGGMSAVEAGYWASIPTAAGIFGALLIPRLATPARRLTILLILYIGAGLATVMIPAGHGAVIAAGLIMQGIARGSMMTVAILVLVEARKVGARNAGLAGGLFFSAAEIGGVLGPLTIGYVSDLTGSFSVPLHILTGVCVALVLSLAWLRRYQG